MSFGIQSDGHVDSSKFNPKGPARVDDAQGDFSNELQEVMKLLESEFEENNGPYSETQKKIVADSQKNRFGWNQINQDSSF